MVDSHTNVVDPKGHLSSRKQLVFNSHEVSNPLAASHVRQDDRLFFVNRETELHERKPVGEVIGVSGWETVLPQLEVVAFSTLPLQALLILSIYTYNWS